MPQYLAPGVYVEEIPGPRTIAGVGTSTAAFVGPCGFGPLSGTPELLTSYLQFARIYGDAVDLDFDDTGVMPNYVALGAKGFFDEGGTSLYVVRTYARTDNERTTGHSRGTLTSGVVVRARFPGTAGDMRVTFTLKPGSNAVVSTGGGNTLARVREYDAVWAVGTGQTGGVYVVRRDPATRAWTLAGNATPLALADATAAYPLTAVVAVQRPTLTQQGLPGFGPEEVIGEFGFDPRAAGTGIDTVLTANPPTRAQALTVPIALESLPAPEAADDVPREVAHAIFDATVLATAATSTTPAANRRVSVTLAHGSDGNAPDVTEYTGNPTTFVDYQNVATALPLNGLPALETLEDVSIVAAPGACTGWNPTAATGEALGQAIAATVVTHCETMRYRVAALDAPHGKLPGDVLSYRNARSSTHAALYYPWVTVAHPVDGRRIDVPPAALMAGVWARTDATRGVIKAPANEAIRSALALETPLTKAQQGLLNPEGVNCLRAFPGAGFLVWGARTISDNPEWKYLNVRRYFNYLERSIDEGTRWVVFEPNGPALWDTVRRTVEGFLLTEWKGGSLAGRKPEEGFYVRCDESTMTFDDLDQGRLICLVGVAALRPAEFVIFRFSQWTATTSQ